ncbi:MAG TPA: hypothetical protein VEO19_06475 [Terriglobia bacterium]|nr:hypothetical protein [Terriglobia bacterium]
MSVSYFERVFDIALSHEKTNKPEVRLLKREDHLMGKEKALRCVVGFLERKSRKFFQFRRVTPLTPTSGCIDTIGYSASLFLSKGNRTGIGRGRFARRVPPSCNS